MPFKTVDIATKYAAREVEVTPEMCPVQVWSELKTAICGLKCYDSHVSMPKKNTLKPLNFLSCFAAACPVHDRNHIEDEHTSEALNLFNVAYDSVVHEVILCCFQSGKKTIRRMSYTPENRELAAGSNTSTTTNK